MPQWPLELKDTGNREGGGDEAARSDTSSMGSWSFLLASILWLKGVAALIRTHLWGQGAASGLSYHHICYTRWSRAAGTHPPAPTLKRWSTPPCSTRTVASPPQEVGQAAKQGGSQWALRSLLTRCANSGDEARNRAGLTKRRHPTAERERKQNEHKSAKCDSYFRLHCESMMRNSQFVKKRHLSKMCDETSDSPSCVSQIRSTRHHFVYFHLFILLFISTMWHHTQSLIY